MEVQYIDMEVFRELMKRFNQFADHFERICHKARESRLEE